VDAGVARYQSYRKAQVASLIDTLGFFGVDLGQIDEGGRPIAVRGGVLTTLNPVRLG
jgi:hypothetical protein